MAVAKKSTVASQVEAMKNRLTAMEADIEKFEVKQQKAAATRLRGDLQDIIAAAKGLRVQILDMRKKM